MRTIRIRVYGRVQGVGFRYYALYTARSLGITGYVRNEPDGSVEVVGSGRDPDIEALIESIDRGPKYANVAKT
jgi:acylphosphatase